MYLIGIDLGTSSIKVSIVDAQSQQVVGSASYPEVEAEIISKQRGWAEQEPEIWWQNTKKAFELAKKAAARDIYEVVGIGISYQMHGLVMVDKNHQVLRPSIIWCDSRAVEIGQRAFDAIGSTTALSHLLNSPGNFTASKLAWVKQNEPEVFAKCHKIMLPGDYLAMKMTGQITTTISGLSEGIFWDFKTNAVSEDIMQYFGFNGGLIADIKNSFDDHGTVSDAFAAEWGISKKAKITYKAGDQPNNALSLNVMEPGEIATTAGTSGVVYAVSDKVAYDAASRVNSFAHVNHTAEQSRLGILLCINGCGILNAWTKRNFGNGLSYDELNSEAGKVAVGSDGVKIYPFGNGAERMLANANPGAAIHGLDLNSHHRAHIFRAVQEGIGFSLNYGFEIMQNLGVAPKVMRAGKANLFLSPVFREIMVNTANVAVELIDSDGAKGAALGAGMGAKVYKTAKDAMGNLRILDTFEPEKGLQEAYKNAYSEWKKDLKF